MNFLKGMADNRSQKSLATRMRRERFQLFLSLLEGVPRPLRILDVGGTQRFWETMNYTASDVHVVLLNIYDVQTNLPNFVNLIGDARNMNHFQDRAFDVVFSNSVIEHVGTLADQQAMAREVQRVGQRYFIQTPNRYFPIEPHFLFPFFQFLPISLRATLVQYFNVGWYKRIPQREKALAEVRSIRLLHEAELRQMFPGATIYREYMFGLKKSLIAYGGW
jgi:hypothetical protein